MSWAASDGYKGQIHDWWDWSVRHPVVRLSFGSGNFTEPGQAEARLTEQLAAIERRAGLAAAYSSRMARASSSNASRCTWSGGSGGNHMRGGCRFIKGSIGTEFSMHHKLMTVYLDD